MTPRSPSEELDTTRLLQTLRDDHIEPDAKNWHPWPGGWPTEISTALIDAVYSAQAVYKTKRGRGVLALVTGWRQANPEQVDSLSLLTVAIQAMGPRQWAQNFGSLQHSPGRRGRRPHAPWKSAAILEAAQKLSGIRITSADDLTPASTAHVERLLRTVPGIGTVTSEYFMMLLGRPGVKADTMIRRYVGRALSLHTSPSPAAAQRLVASAAHQRLWPVVDLEHSIWEYERGRH